MNISKVKKIAVLLLIIGLIFIQVLNPRVNATSFDLNSLLGNEMGNQIGDDGNVTVGGNNTVENNAIENNTSVNNTSVNTQKNNTTLPQAGANENMIIALIVICAISGVYAYKKVKEYNM